MRKSLLIFSNLFPSDAFPMRAMFNKQQFEKLAEVFDVRVIVPVGWMEWFRHGYRSKQAVSTLDCYYFPYFYTPGFFRSMYGFFMWLSLLFVRRSILLNSPDVVIASWAFPDAVAMARFLNDQGIPLIAKVHGSDVNVHCEDRFRRRQIVRTLKQSKAVLSVSRSLRSKLVSYGVPAEKIKVVYNGVDSTKFYPKDLADTRRRLGLPVGAKVFLFIGNLLVAKGALDLLAGFMRLEAADRDDRLTLIYIGDGADRPLLEKEIRMLTNASGTPDVRLVGRKPHDELNDWINAADYVCLPSHNEGVPNVLLEAMSCGKPVIATRAGGIPEVVTAETGILVEARDIPALAEAMSEALRVGWNMGRIVEHSRQFNWDRNVAAIEEIVNDSCRAGSLQATRGLA